MTRIQTTIFAMLFSLVATMAGPAAAQDAAGTKAPAERIIVVQQPVTPEVTTRDLDHIKEILRNGLATQDLLDQERTNALKEIIAEQDKRISDLHAKADWFALLVAFLTILIAVGATISFVSATRSAAKKAVNEAKDWLLEDATKEAKQLSDSLVKDSRAEIATHITELEQELHEKIAERISEANDQFDAFKTEAENNHRKIQDMVKHVEKTLQKGGKGGDERVPEADKVVLNRAAQEAGAKPEAEKTYDDWHTQAIVAYLNNEYAAAAESFGRAALAADATQAQAAGAIFYKGLTYVQAGDTKSAIAAYDDVDRHFADSEAPELRELVARALYNKGLVYADSGDDEAAIAAYDKVVHRFANSEIPELREYVADALNGSADARRNQAKDLWLDVTKEGQAKDILAQSMAGLDQALESGFDNIVKYAAANKAYALFLLERDQDEVERLLRQAVEIGGEDQYGILLEDITKHPIPRDEKFKALVERVWGEVQAEQVGGGDKADT